MNETQLKIESEFGQRGTFSDKVSKSKLHTKIITDFDSLRLYATRWDNLLLQNERPVPMSSFAWLAGYFLHRLKPSEEWACLVALEGDELLGVLPLVITPGTRFGQQYPIIRTPYDSHTYSVDICVHPQKANRVIKALLDSVGETFPDWCELQMIRLAETSPTIKHIPNGLHQVATIKEQCDSESVLDTVGSYENYYAGLSRNFRRAIRKATRRNDRDGQLQFVTLKGDDSLEGFRIFIDIDATSWRASQGDDLLSQPALIKSHQTAIELMADSGWPQFNILIKNNKPIAAQMAFHIGNSLIIKKVTHRDDHKRFSPGNMLYQQTLKEAFANPAISLVNCLTDMSWHKNWKMYSRLNYHLWIFGKRWLPLTTRYLTMRTKQLAHYIPGLARIIRWHRSHQT